jgi:HEAT repeat protein
VAGPEAAPIAIAATVAVAFTATTMLPGALASGALAASAPGRAPIAVTAAPSGAIDPQAGQIRPQREVATTDAALQQAIDQLGSFDFETRTAASRLVRRAPAAQAAPRLAEAARAHKDEYVRFRALVLLAGLNDPGTTSLMRALMTDRNDRLRTVAAGWFEHHPSPDVLPLLLAALERESSEFVRPAVTRAVAAHGDDSRARDAILPLVDKGQDFFRGAAIEALGDYRAAYAVSAILQVAALDGPLQDDAITALGKIGDRSALATLPALQKSAPRDVQPTISAAFCLLGQDCDGHKKFIRETLAYAVGRDEHQAVVRGAVHALGVLALRGHDDALTTLIDAAAGADETVRAPIALGVGLVALRNPETLLRVLGRQADPKPGILLLRDAFDMLNEDFEEERFYVFVRRAYWAAAEASAERRLAEALIVQLEF